LLHRLLWLLWLHYPAQRACHHRLLLAHWRALRWHALLLRHRGGLLRHPHLRLLHLRLRTGNVHQRLRDGVALAAL
jgi:hypothetical protein